MNKWREVTLGEIADINMGQSPKSVHYNQIGEGTEFLQGNRTFGRIYPYFDTYTTKVTKLVDKGDILFTVRAPVGDINIANSQICIGRGIVGIRSKENQEFLYYSLLYNKESLKTAENGTTYGSVNKADLNNFKFRIPNTKMQEKIANVLSTYDKLIENNNRRIEVLEQTAEEIYKEWFVRMRFPGYENMKFDKGIPEGWELKKVDDIISFDIGGGWGKDSPEEGFTEEAHVIRGTDIPNMKYGEINYELLRFHKGSQLRNRRLQSSDIIFEASGGSKDQRLGRTYYITDETLAMYDDDVICASFCKLIRIDEKYLSWYFNNYLNYAYKTETLSIFEVQSTGISNFGFTKFKKHHQVLLPPADLMKHFFELTYSMYIEEQRLGRKNQNLKIQRDLLLPRLMNGTIEVK